MISADFEKYLKMSLWTKKECISLVFGIDILKFENALPKTLERSSNQFWTDTLPIDRELFLDALKKAKHHDKIVKDAIQKMTDILSVMDRDLEFGLIKPYDKKNGIYYFNPRDFIDWAISKSFDVPVELKEFAKSKTTTAPPIVQSNNEPTTTNKQTKVQKHHAAILEVIRIKGFNPLAIPDGEKGTIEDICRADYPLLFNRETSFHTAWKKRKGLFNMANF